MPALLLTLIFGLTLSGCFSHNVYIDTYSPKLSGNVDRDFVPLDAFDSVKISGSFSATFIPDAEHSVTVIADDALFEFISIITEDNEIEIKFNRNIRTSDRVELEIRSPFIRSVNTSGSISAVFEDVTSDTLRLRASGSGTFSGTGAFDVLNIHTSGSARVNGENMIANQIIIRSSGSSRMIVHALDEITARISGSGNITYFGDPAKVDSQISGSGSVRKAE